MFIDGDHSEAGCELRLVLLARASSPSAGASSSTTPARASRAGAGCPGPSAVVTRHFRGEGTPGWEIVAEADRTVAVRRTR